MTPIRVLLVDDSALIRRVITRLLESRGEFQIIDTAVDGEEAVRKICALKPDVVSLDLEMPVLDGLGVLRRVMRQCPVPVVMLSSLTTAGAQATMQALSLGAVDFVAKPSRPGQLDAMVNELAEKLRTAAGVNTGRLLRTLLQKAMTHRPAEEKGAADHDAAAAGPAAVSPAAREEEKQPVSSSPPVATGPAWAKQDGRGAGAVKSAGPVEKAVPHQSGSPAGKTEPHPAASAPQPAGSPGGGKVGPAPALSGLKPDYTPVSAPAAGQPAAGGVTAPAEVTKGDRVTEAVGPTAGPVDEKSGRPFPAGPDAAPISLEPTPAGPAPSAPAAGERKSRPFYGRRPAPGGGVPVPARRTTAARSGIAPAAAAPGTATAAGSGANTTAAGSGSTTTAAAGDTAAPGPASTTAAAARRTPAAPFAPPLVVVPKRAAARVDLVVVGSSTGGPAALQVIIPALPQDFPAALVLVQHIPRGFSASLAEHLNRRSRLPVKHAVEGDPVIPGRVLVAPAGFELTFRGQPGHVTVHLDAGRGPVPPGGFRPSVDGVMLSAAEIFGARAMGVLLTGMGRDGARGMAAIREKGGPTIAQDEASCVVFGMPKAAIELGAAERVVPLDRVAGEMVRMIQQTGIS